MTIYDSSNSDERAITSLDSQNRFSLDTATSRRYRLAVGFKLEIVETAVTIHEHYAPRVLCSFNRIIANYKKTYAIFTRVLLNFFLSLSLRLHLKIGTKNRSSCWQLHVLVFPPSKNRRTSYSIKNRALFRTMKFLILATVIVFILQDYGVRIRYL